MRRFNPVLKRYLITTSIFIVILITSLIVNNVIFAGHLRHSFRARTQVLIENAHHYLEGRWELYFTSSLAINLDRLPAYRNPYNLTFYHNTQSILTNLRILQFSNPEIADIIVFHDDLDVFINTDGTWSRELLFHWKTLDRFQGIDFSFIDSDVINAIFTRNGNLVYYNNVHRDTHIFISLYPSVLGNMLEQFVPNYIGTFTVMSLDGSLFPISNGGDIMGDTYDFVFYSDLLPLVYHFYYSPLAYSEAIMRTTLISIGIVFIIALLAILMLLRIKKDLYNPLLRIMDNLNIARKDPYNEFSLIMNAIDLLRTKTEHNNFSNAITNDETEKIKDIIGSEHHMFCAMVILFEDEEGNKHSSQLKKFPGEMKSFAPYPIFVMEKYSIYYFFFEDQAQYCSLINSVDDYLAKYQGYCQCGFSTLQSDLTQINTTFEEALLAFHEVKTDGLEVQKKSALYDGFISDGRFSITQHHRILAHLLNGNIDQIKTTILDIINENNLAGVQAKRRLLLNLYDTINMLTKQSAGKEVNQFTNIYNLQLLFDNICTELAATIAPKSETEAASEWIDRNLHRDISLSDFAEAMGMSYSYASTFFKSKMDMNFLGYLQLRRIEHAKQLLVSTDKSIDEVATLTGFVSIKTFFRVFKKYAGVTPGIYRDTASRERQYNR